MEKIWNKRYQVIALAEKASDAIIEIYHSAYHGVETKQDQTPVTLADKKSHEIIEFGLQQLTHEIPVLSEESDMSQISERKDWTRYWLIDPLDGTKEFIAKTGEFTVNIALIDNHKPIFGVVYVPETKTCYFAGSGCGAWKQVGDESPELIQTGSGAEPLTVTISARTDKEPVESFLKNFANYQFLIAGSSLKMCYIAEGEADIYPRLGPTSEWDTAAAQIILQQAGGGILDRNLKPLTYNVTESLLNPHFLAVSDTSAGWIKKINKQVMSSPDSIV
jgi:3'(2'), 5'-bisphosphate nucleotidase